MKRNKIKSENTSYEENQYQDERLRLWQKTLNSRDVCNKVLLH